MSGVRKPAKKTRKSPQELLDAVQERLDATPERLARAREAGETPTRDADRTRRLLDPFDTMRANRVLAPHDPKLNDIRWLVGDRSAAPISAPGSTNCARSRPTASARPGLGPAPACRNPRPRSSPATSCARPRSGSARTLGRS
jgi:hypothetical protein